MHSLHKLPPHFPLNPSNPLSVYLLCGQCIAQHRFAILKDGQNCSPFYSLIAEFFFLQSCPPPRFSSCSNLILFIEDELEQLGKSPAHSRSLWVLSAPLVLFSQHLISGRLVVTWMGWKYTSPKSLVHIC